MNTQLSINDIDSAQSSIAKHHDEVITVGNQQVQIKKMTEKVINDIHFLEDRIEKIKQLKSPNSTILKTYQEMLNSREAVLSWLQNHHALKEHTDIQAKAN